MVVEGEQKGSKRQEQTVSFKIGSYVLDFITIVKTKKGDAYLVPLQKLSINSEGKGSGLHFSYHPENSAAYIKAYNPILSLKFADIKELEAKSATVFEKIIAPPVSKSPIHIQLLRPDDLVTQTNGKRMVLDMKDAEKAVAKIVELPDTNNLKEELRRLEQNSETKGGKLIVGNGFLSYFVPLTTEQIKTMNRKYLSENSIRVIEEYGGLIISLTDKTVISLLEDFGLDAQAFQSMVETSFAGGKALIKDASKELEGHS